VQHNVPTAVARRQRHTGVGGRCTSVQDAGPEQLTYGASCSRRPSAVGDGKTCMHHRADPHLTYLRPWLLPKPCVSHSVTEHDMKQCSSHSSVSHPAAQSIATATGCTTPFVGSSAVAWQYGKLYARPQSCAPHLIKCPSSLTVSSFLLLLLSCAVRVCCAVPCCAMLCCAVLGV
jgi:hypothetical protein